MEYDLVRMGSSEFEDMAVALCSAALGVGGQTYGVGRDGGREWTYKGVLPLPKIQLEDEEWGRSRGDSWDGYSVIQAKHKSRLEGGTSDVDWLLTTVQKEVNSWLSPDKDRKPKPRNLLIITNVRLSAVQEVGGIDRVAEAMTSHSAKLGLEGWAVWHAAHISRLLDNHPRIRQTYLGLLVTGDLMESMLQILQTENPDPLRALTNFVVKDLLAQSTVRLTRAGNGPNKELLADVGIDLPSQDIRAAVISEDDKSGPVHFAQNMIAFGDSPRSVSNGSFCTVLLGGPGQGKSTVGQLICQAYRVDILKDQADKLPPQHRNILRDTINHLETIDLPLPRLRRWPVYVRLSEYSERILGDEDYSLLGFIADQINKHVSAPSIKKNHVYAWLRQFPWLLVLDGLDEVPDTATRDTLFAKISDFVADAADQKADISILATTRRQGYENDLRPLMPREFELVDLNTGQALDYARQLVSSRHPTDQSYADEIHSRLEEATGDVVTAKLMGTPLQVSIMVSLLEDRIRLPRTRHALFADFYDTIYMRESNKIGAVGKRVLEHRFSIDALHNEAGVLLHAEAEKSGLADVHLTLDQLRTLARNHLHVTMTYEMKDAEKTSRELIGLATDRLILLVEPSPGKWGYELRSFQEYTASRFLVEGESDEALGRLRILAKSTHWRNTWLFAAGQLFERSHHLRSQILDLVFELDENSVLHYWTKPGSDLAGDLLADNFATTMPGLRRRLVLRVAEYVDNPMFEVTKLVSILHAASEEDRVVYQKVQESFEQALHAGGARAFYAQITMGYWLRNFKGGISSYIRTKIGPVPVRVSQYRETMTPKTRVNQYEKRYKSDSLGITFYQIVSPHLDLGGLNKAEIKLLERALQNVSVNFIILGGDEVSDITVIRGKRNPLESIFRSDKLFEVVIDACLSLSGGQARVYGWFLSQASQAIGQDYGESGLLDIEALPRLS